MPRDRVNFPADRWLLRVAHNLLRWREATSSRRCPACAGERQCHLRPDGRAVWCATVSDRGLITVILEAIERRLEAFERTATRQGPPMRSKARRPPGIGWEP